MASFGRQRAADLPFQADVAQWHQSKTAVASVAKDLTYGDCLGFDSFVRSTQPDRCIRTSLHDLSSQYLTPGLAKVAHLRCDARRLSRSHALEESDVLQPPGAKGVFAYDGACTQTLDRVSAVKKHLSRHAEAGGCRGPEALAYDTRDTPV